VKLGAHFQEGHTVQLLQGGQEFFPALTADIEASQSEVRLETYIFHFDNSGEQVAAALERAAQRGVQVFVLMDGIGTGAIPDTWALRWTQAGVQWQIYSPLKRWGLLSPRSWRRLHRKLCVVDGVLAYCGGINVLDDWHDPVWGAQDSARFDFAVRVAGPLVQDVRAAMQLLWNRLPGNRALRRNPIAPMPATTRPAQQTAGIVRAALVLRDNLLHRRQIERSYLKAIGEARHDILLANAYFLPGLRLRRALKLAAHRGVRVRLLVQGRYEYFMQFHANRPVYGPLVAAGVEIYEYQPGFLHAKVAAIDGRWATVGSSNLDPLSLLLAREANVVVVDGTFSVALAERLANAMEAQAQRIDSQALARRSVWQRFLDYLAFALMRSLLFLTGKQY
jgi:cardiolipin synthase A/B